MNKGGNRLNETCSYCNIPGHNACQIPCISQYQYITICILHQRTLSITSIPYYSTTILQHSSCMHLLNCTGILFSIMKASLFTFLYYDRLFLVQIIYSQETKIVSLFVSFPTLTLIYFLFFPFYLSTYICLWLNPLGHQFVYDGLVSPAQALVHTHLVVDLLDCG